MKSREEVEKLKEDWAGDPIWDIEETEGFEDYKDELRAFRSQKEKEWDQEWEWHLLARANELRCSSELVEYIEKLEDRLTEMDRRFERLDEAIGKRSGVVRVIFPDESEASTGGR